MRVHPPARHDQEGKGRMTVPSNACGDVVSSLVGRLCGALAPNNLPGGTMGIPMADGRPRLGGAHRHMSHTGGQWRRGASWPGVRLGYEQVPMERLAPPAPGAAPGARAASRYKTHQAASGGA